MKLGHLRELDGVRAVAALMVIFAHFFQSVKTDSTLVMAFRKYALFGLTGVSLFFVLSGFLITRILLNTKKSNSYFKTFYFRRLLRIFPLYYLFLIIYYFLLPLLQNIPVQTFNHQIWYWVYLQNIPMTFGINNSGPEHFWSLAVEEHFYFFWPLAIYYMNNKQIKNFIYLIIFLAFLTRAFMVSNGYEIYYFTLSRMDELVIGAFLAILEREGKLNSYFLKKLAKFFFAGLVLVIIIVVCLGGKDWASFQSLKFFFISGFYFFSIGTIIILQENRGLKKFLKRKEAAFTGKISYGLYVYHPLCIYLVNTYFNYSSVIVAFIITITSTFILASISYYFYELKFLELKTNYSYN